jgi:hypothetical protein
MISLGDLIASFRQRKLQIDCRSITLTQSASHKPVTYSGKGYIRQNDDDTLSLKLYGTETLNTDMFASFKREAGGMPGVLYGESDYFTMKAVSVDNDTWTSDRILPRGNWDARDPNPVVHASLSRLVKDHGTVSDDSNLTLYYFEDADIPCIIDKMVFKAAGADFEIKKGDQEFTVHVRSEQELPEHFHTRAEESLRFLLAQSVAWRVLILNSGNRYRVELAAGQPRSRRVLLDPPIHRGSHGFLEESWRLFGLYLDYVLRTTPYPHWNVLSYHIHNTCEASANSLDAWAIGLSVAIEGIANLLDIELPEAERAKLEALRKFIIAQVASSDEHKEFVKRVEGLAQGLPKIRAADRLRRLAEDGKVRAADLKAWQALRNKQVHPAGAPESVTGRDYQRDLDLIHQAVVLMYHVVFQLIGYTGKFTDYTARGYPNRDYPGLLVVAPTEEDAGSTK